MRFITFIILYDISMDKTIKEIKSLLVDKEHIKLFDLICADYLKRTKKKDKHSVKVKCVPTTIRFD
jgi:hypothetical protein